MIILLSTGFEAASGFAPEPQAETNIATTSNPMTNTRDCLFFISEPLLSALIPWTKTLYCSW
jgi:hypothetical protein